MRIIAGIHKGRNITSTSGAEMRPTTSRTREALFSILSSGQFLREEGGSVLQGARIADICCGSGALGLESLSRGAEHVTFVDRDGEHLHAVRTTIDQFGEAHKATFIRADVTALPSCRVPYTLVFLDPPYHKSLIAAALKGLISRNWLAQGAIIIAEMGKNEKLDVPEGLIIQNERIYGKTKIVILGVV